MKVAVVTGVSRGLGQAMLPLAINRFDHVVAIGRRLPSGFTPSSSLSFLAADFRETHDWPAMLARSLRLSEGDELVFLDNASILTISAVGQPDFIDGLAEAMQVNMITPAAIASALIGASDRARARLRIIHISTGAARRAIAGWGTYCISKAAAAMLQNVVAADHPHVETVSIDPGVMDTDMQAAIRADSDVPVGQQDMFRKLKADGELVAPADVAVRIFREAGL